MFKKYLFTPKLPKIHYEDNVGFAKKWFFNPLKRWAAKYYLKFLRTFTRIRVIGITGSAGKTTTKEMLAAILAIDGKTIFSKANIDPIYNIPNTILKTPPGTKYLILEMGVEYPDEMDFYLWLATPDVGVITNIFPTHLEFFGNEEGVFKEKSKLALGLNNNGCAILNADDYRLKKLGKKLSCKVVWFKSDTDPTTQNSNCADSVSRALGIPDIIIKKGLTGYKPPEHRLNWISLEKGIKILDDSYNSNPQAAKTAIKVFLDKTKNLKKVAVLGDMLELGEYEQSAHREIGRKLAESNFDFLIGVGEATKYTIDEAEKVSKKSIKTFRADDYLAAGKLLKPLLTKNTAVLIKGSHGIALYKLVDKLV